ncbi:MAG: anti-sigma factor family protein [Acidimicrobiales bacterium]
MDCAESRTLLATYLDGELAADRAAAVEQHLGTCPICRGLLQRERALSGAIRQDASRFTAPPYLGARILTTLGIGERRHGPWSLRLLGVGWNPAAIAASLLLTVVASSALTNAYLRGGEEDAVMRAVVASEVRSLMANHLTDVTSTDQHTVKPWFNGKLDFSPPVVDLAADGFPLIGGRLDYLDHRPVAALVYKHAQHAINVFVWPEAGEEKPRFASRQGYNLIYFKQGGMEFWVVSEISPADLKEFASRLSTELATVS